MLGERQNSLRHRSGQEAETLCVVSNSVLCVQVDGCHMHQREKD